MKFIRIYIFSGILMLSSLCFQSCLPTVQESSDTENSELSNENLSNGASYQILTDKSVIQWTGRKLTGKHEGTLNIQEGRIWIKKQEITGGRLILDMNSILVSDLKGKDKEDLETHLKDGDFFETDLFPTGKFVITEIKPVSEELFTHEIKGNLTLKGITQSIRFPAFISWEAEKLMVQANFHFDRTRWGIVYKGRLDNLIKDDIHCILKLQAVPEN